MNNNLFMLLPLLAGMKNGNSADMLSLFSRFAQSADGKQNPMQSILLNMMSKQKPAVTEDKLDAIRRLSGAEVTEALKILLNTRRSC